MPDRRGHELDIVILDEPYDTDCYCRQPAQYGHVGLCAATPIWAQTVREIVNPRLALAVLKQQTTALAAIPIEVVPPGTITVQLWMPGDPTPLREPTYVLNIDPVDRRPGITLDGVEQLAGFTGFDIGPDTVGAATVYVTEQQDENGRWHIVETGAFGPRHA